MTRTPKYFNLLDALDASNLWQVFTSQDFRLLLIKSQVPVNAPVSQALLRLTQLSWFASWTSRACHLRKASRSPLLLSSSSFLDDLSASSKYTLKRTGESTGALRESHLSTHAVSAHLNG